MGVNGNGVAQLVQQWAQAELNGDPDALGGLLTDDFTAVGPRGFVLNRDMWLERYRSKSLRNASFALLEPQIREYGDAAVVVGTQAQSSSYQGRETTGDFRATLVAVMRDGRWRLAGVHLSPVAGMPG
jgi:uncharacterized protein (TIGR02246 family)